VRRLVVLAALAAALWAAPGAFAAGWCGTGESSTDRPDAATGPQVHAVVVQPADGPDNFAADANRLADDVTSLSGWWVGQDPTRVPRFDLATFPAGPCLDITYLRLLDPASSLTGAGASAAFNLIATALEASGFSNPYKDYYVYYDGPSVETDVCGTGAGEFDRGPSFAFVWLAGCTDIPSDSIGTHELLHAFGALPDGAPHACPGDPGHPCDSPTDILYPYAATGITLAQQVLDFGHDDYYGHNGSWADLQDSFWLHRLDLPVVPLSLGVSGVGDVSSDVPGIDCTASCTTQWDQGSLVSLAAEAVPGSRFIRWSGACTGSNGCSLTLSAALAVSAVFGPTRIPVRVATAGRGRVECAPTCSNSFRAGSRLTLRAIPAKGWRFAAWSGGCKGRRATCVPPTNFALSIKATFRRR
jgi:hypothetical protein